MGIFRPRSGNRIDELADRLVSPLNSIALALAGVISGDELHGTLSQARRRLPSALSGLDHADHLAAYQKYWTKQRVVLQGLFESGTPTVDDVRRLQLEWIRTLPGADGSTARRLPLAERPAYGRRATDGGGPGWPGTSPVDPAAVREFEST